MNNYDLDDQGQALFDLTKEVAEHLDGFIVDYDEPYIRLTGPEQAVLIVTSSHDGDDITFKITSRHWADLKIRVPGPEQVTVPAVTEPDAIAVQLTRDLLAWYLTTLRGVSARNTENERLAATRDERVARLLAIIPEASIPPPPHWRGAVTVDASWRDPSWQDNPTWLAATIHVGLTRTDMNITDCDETLTIRVAEAIADHYRRHHPPDPEAAVEQDPVPAPGTEADAPVGGGS